MGIILLFERNPFRVYLAKEWRLKMSKMNLLVAAAIPAALFAVPAAAQDSESFEIALSGSVASVCDITPEGTGSYNVDMLDTNNQGFLIVAFSCNSPYIVTLESANGGMEHQESGGSVLIDYDVEATFGGFGTVNSAVMAGSPQTIVTETNWANILTNGGVRSGNMDLQFGSLAEYAVAGTYEDTLTIAVTAQL